jgi:hypothetical protein
MSVATKGVHMIMAIMGIVIIAAALALTLFNHLSASGPDLPAPICLH